jgi:hypothetical protein
VVPSRVSETMSLFIDSPAQIDETLSAVGHVLLVRIHEGHAPVSFKVRVGAGPAQDLPRAGSDRVAALLEVDPLGLLTPDEIPCLPSNVTSGLSISIACPLRRLKRRVQQQ